MNLMPSLIRRTVLRLKDIFQKITSAVKQHIKEVRQAQKDFNDYAENYANRHGLEAFEAHMNTQRKKKQQIIVISDLTKKGHSYDI